MLPSLIYMKLGFCHLGFRVCSVRHVWYVTKRPSKEEAAEGDQSPLERETAIPANWMGCAQPAGEWGLFIVLWLLALVYNQKGGPLPKACLVATICSWGLCASQVAAPSSPDRLRFLNYQSLQILIPCPSESHLQPSVCEKEEKTKEPSVARLRESLQDDSLPTGGILLAPCLAGDARGVSVLPCF